MSESFSVGEIAIWVGLKAGDPRGYGPKTPCGTEVLIVQSLQSRYVRTANGIQILNVYEARTCDGITIAAFPHSLRKRRPPQDWVKLCELNDIPRDIAKPEYAYEWSWNRG